MVKGAQKLCFGGESKYGGEAPNLGAKRPNPLRRSQDLGRVAPLNSSFYIRYNIRNLPLFIALVVKVLSEKIFVIDRKQNVKQISYDGRECACLSISILFFSKTTHAMLNCLFMPNIRQYQLFIKVTAHFKCFCISASTIKCRHIFTISGIQRMLILNDTALILIMLNYQHRITLSSYNITLQYILKGIRTFADSSFLECLFTRITLKSSLQKYYHRNI